MAAHGVQLVKCLQRRPLTKCYLGEEEATGAPLFVKTLHSRQPGVVRNFVREEGVLRALQDLPGTPQLVASNAGAAPPFLAYRWIAAVPLLECAAGEERLEGLLAHAQALAAWVAALHARGFAHRDLSPDHVFVGEDGAALVVDFGLAKPAADHLARAYDVQAVGMILWELICGRPLFGYRQPALRRQIAAQLELIETLALAGEVKDLLRALLAGPSELVPEGPGHPGITASEACAVLGELAGRSLAPG